MSDKMRWRYGDTNPVVATVGSGTVIEVGDLLWRDVDDAKPASEIPPGMVAPRGEVFADNFLGAAMQRSRSGDTDPIRVATTGVFEFDCPSGTFGLGAFVGPCEKIDRGSCGGLANQQVASVSASRYAIGRVAKFEHAAVRSVLVDIRSTVMTGGVKGTTAP